MTAPETTAATPAAGEVNEAVEHLFRHESAKIIATLTRIFGVEHLTLAEDVVQEALARALQTWPFYGLPKNPAGWIMQTARHLALDVVRRQKVFRDKEAEIALLAQTQGPVDAAAAAIFPEQEIADDRLRLMFVCCHPAVPADAQAALALKTLCGFGVGEIAQAFLTSEAAMAKRLTRAKQKIRDERIAFEIPAGEELSRRLDAVLATLYLLFNEGYKASAGDKLVREEVCGEAIRLTALLSEHPAGNQPRARALLALMLLNAARLRARVDGDGHLLLLKRQDRSLWDQTMLARGMFHLARSAAGDTLSEYHLQAGIAAWHCAAADYAATDWPQILALYDQWAALNDSPIIALNRAIVVGEINGPRAGLDAIEAIRHREKLESYHLYYAALGEFESQLDDPLAAAGYFRKSLQLAETTSERRFLTARFRECEAQLPAMA